MANRYASLLLLAMTSAHAVPGANACLSIKDTERAKACVAPKMTRVLKAKLLENLRDPDSAKFYGEALYESDSPSATALCGVVNSKNAYGGYAGKSGFIVTTNGLVILQSSETPELFQGAWQQWCTTPFLKR